MHGKRQSDRQLAERGALTDNDKQTEGRVMHGKRQSDRQLAERGATLSMPERGSESGYTCARF